MVLEGKKISVIASDFDGTLLRNGAERPSEELYNIVNELLAKDVFFIAASGRLYDDLYQMMCSLNKEIAYISENGCLVLYKNEVIHKEVMNIEFSKILLEDLEKEEDAEILISPSKVKIAICFLKGITKEKETWYHEKYDEIFQVVDAGNNWLDFNPKGSGKGPALQILAEKLGFKLEETLAFGDSENDISMLQMAGISYAMNTAKLHVKESANFECESVEEIIKKIY